MFEVGVLLNGVTDMLMDYQNNIKIKEVRSTNKIGDFENCLRILNEINARFS